LEKMIQAKEMDGALDLIEQLDEMPITLNILSKTKIGAIVKTVSKKSTSHQLTKKAKSLIRKLKSSIEKKGSSSPADRRQSSRSENAGDEFGVSSTDQGSSNIQQSNKFAAKASNGNAKVCEMMTDLRQKCVEMLTGALQKFELPHGTVMAPEDLAVRIEQKLHEVHNGNDVKYKAALRSRVFNLRDEKNPALRENVLTGTVSPEVFAVMTTEEMASDEMKEKRLEFNKEAILEHQLSVQEGVESESFQCGKCKSKKCTYTQLQTRSADEPLTTFVYCGSCGNRWKFS